jgi:hypothetical protein
MAVVPLCGRKADARRCQEPTSFKELRDLRAAFRVAQEVGEGVERGEVLFRQVPGLER